MNKSNQGNVFIVAAPSGGGKTSLIKNLVTTLDYIAISVSHTTRKPRPGEKEGEDYFFIDKTCFQNMIHADEFIEHAEVFNYHYGTSFAQINSRLAAGIDVILDIDWQGAAQIRLVYPKAVSIFIIPPSLTILKQRLQDRQQDKENVINQRMQQAQDELKHFAEFDYLIVNDDFVKACAELQAIVIANRLSLSRQQTNMRELLSLLLATKIKS